MPTAELSIPGTTAVITAAGRGIGLEVATKFASAGIDVAINDIDADTLDSAESSLAAYDGDTVAVQGDAANPSAMQRLIETAVEEFGGIDILINNVGISGPWKPLAEVDNEEFMQTLSVNLGGVHNATAAAIPYLTAGDYGRIVNMSSRIAKDPLAERGPYSISKMGVIAFTRTLAVELGDQDVTVNAVCPGPVRGERVDSALRERAETWDLEADSSFEEILENLREDSPIHENLQAEDVADTILFLCSEQADKVTGQDVNVTAGRLMD